MTQPDQILTPTYAAVVLIIPDGAGYVMIREAKPACHGLWSLPGGRVEPGESLLVAAEREALEETGLEVKLRGLLRVEHTRFSSNEVAPTRERYRFIIEAERIGGELKTKADAESLEARVLTAAELRDMPLRDVNCFDYFESIERGEPLLPISAYKFDFN